MTRLVRTLCSCALPVLLLSGCATSVFRAYEGQDLPADQVATIDVSPEVDVLKIQGVTGVGLRSYMPGRADAIHLPPGTNTLTVRYSTIYDAERDDYQAFYSRQVPLTFVARAGARYRIAHDPVPEDPIRALTPREVRLWIEEASDNGRGTPVEPVVPAAPSPPPSQTASAAETPVVPVATPAAGPTDVIPGPEVASSTEVAVDEAVPFSGRLETLNLLKFWWTRANEEDRRAFLHWIEP